MTQRIRVGVVGAGDNTRKRHIPGLRAIPGVDIVVVCNRREESSAAVAREFGIPEVAARWQDVVDRKDIDAIVVGTWPYLHCPIALAALRAGKHLLTEARLSMNAAEAHAMRNEARKHPKLVAQVVPSPFGLTGDAIMRELIDSGYLGQLREYQVFAQLGNLNDPDAPLSWRQDAKLSGFNMLTLGILHETVSRWLPQPIRVMAQSCAFIVDRFDPAAGIRRPVETPDSVQALTVLPNGARGVYHLSGVVPFGGAGMGVRLHGSHGYLVYDLTSDRICGTRSSAPPAEIPLPPDKARGWRVEEDFIRSIREGMPVELTSFDAGVAYMEFTEAVARSSLAEQAVELPLEEFVID